MYGGTLFRSVGTVDVTGLSPRVRGNRHNPSRLFGDIGSIPACTGEPARCRTCGLIFKVYPRVYGGTIPYNDAKNKRTGLSPRVRGNHIPKRTDLGKVRSIPACTGEPHAALATRLDSEVYPRVYGGTPQNGSKTTSPGGLSPRVRGNRADRQRPGVGQRSIPACTGEPGQNSGCSAKNWVYPRVYGGTIVAEASLPSPIGLSPRVRGNRQAVDLPPHHLRSIPACTGEPRDFTISHLSPAVYPRVYGGTIGLPFRGIILRGLSPRVRGNPPPAWLCLQVRGSIPACTGEPVVPVAPVIHHSVYPRVYGGTSTEFIRLFAAMRLFPGV